VKHIEKLMMTVVQRVVLGLCMWAVASFAAVTAQAAENTAIAPQQVLRAWYGLTLELVRHTPTYSPPVASRSMAYLGITAFEAMASGPGPLRSLAGQVTALTPPPPRQPSVAYDDAMIMHAALAAAVRTLFANTGPTGQRVMERFEAKWRAEVASGLPADVVARSDAHGRAVAEHILAWANTDGGALIENMGFPYDYALTPGPAHWVPTSKIAQQQKPLLPNWAKNRPFMLPSAAACLPPPPPAYSEDKNSAFYAEAKEVFDTNKNLTPAQKATARFWSDDPMLSPTPPGHWISIALQIMDRDQVPIDRSVDVLARLGMGLADAFIGTWHAKYTYDLLRPVTYIRRTMEPNWESPLITPPFPEYPSGHSVQSGAAAAVLTAQFGEAFAFEDATHVRDKIPPRKFASFWAAAEEAGISRLYGGIHFRAAIDRGLDQGRCIGALINGLQTSK
jgi:PAP2 superfamily